METARRLFFDQGYAQTGIAQILKEAGVKSGSLYYFFPAKEDLLAAVLELYLDLLEPAVLQPAYAVAVSPIDRVFAILDGYRQLMVATDFRLGCPIGNLALETSNDYPKIRDLVVRNFEQWREAVKALLKDSEARMPKDVDPEQVSFMLLASMEGAVMLSRAYRSLEPFDKAISAARMYLEVLMNRQTDKEGNTP